ncbi:Holliday junction resolvase RuvX [Candidatus Methylopumilus turicensis]|uniref:Putative pre-16S rRNA nuclease n=1 Tax=Candidatus Methylopumilus turicensis TaxID=1581680 RepID=A0A0B7IYM3_9PROT|nr:Holliday junction resolvase RuvX [Candidatus Methylopumilus turicensis]CEN55526.1 Holliday junction resolvase [Candidatus Methylopumilus turicensis]
MLKSLQAINNDKTIQPTFAGTVLGFDFGLKRIGVASGEHMLGIAHPLTTLNAESNDDRFNLIANLIKEWKPTTLIVGLPLSLDGQENEVTLLSKKFARRMDGRFNLPIIMIDERFSSAEASQSLSESGIKGRKQKPMLDQMAAQVILQSYFDTITHEMSKRQHHESS